MTLRSNSMSRREQPDGHQTVVQYRHPDGLAPLEAHHQVGGDVLGPPAPPASLLEQLYAHLGPDDEWVRKSSTGKASCCPSMVARSSAAQGSAWGAA